MGAIYATAANLADIFRPLTSEEMPVAAALLAEASVKLRTRVPNLDDMVAKDEDKAALAASAVANAVKRVLLNPSGMKQLSQTGGPFSESGTYEGVGASGAIDFTTADLVGLVASTSSAPGVARVRSGHPHPGGMRW